MYDFIIAELFQFGFYPQPNAQLQGKIDNQKLYTFEATFLLSSYEIWDWFHFRKIKTQLLLIFTFYTIFYLKNMIRAKKIFPSVTCRRRRPQKFVPHLQSPPPS
jgi:hypothetical protein